MFSFGKPATQNSGSGGGGLFGQTNTGSGFSFNQGNTGTSMFNQNANQGISATNNSTNNTNSTGLFGNKPAGTTTTGSGSGGLFGSKPTGMTFGTTGLFGNNNNNNNSSTTTTNTTGGTGGLFGSKPANTGSLFGSSGTTGGGLFGSKPAFGSSGTSGTGGLFGSQQSNVSALESVSQLPVTPMTRLSDLPLQLKQEIEQLDQHIQRQVQICQHLKADATEHMELLESVPRDMAFLQKTQSQTNQLLAQDLKKISTIKDLTDKNISDSQTFSTMLQQLLTPGSKVSSLELDRFFQQKIQTYERRLDEYTRVLSDIESVVNGICNEVIGEGATTSSSASSSSGVSSNIPGAVDGSNSGAQLQTTASDIMALKTGLNFIVDTVIEEFNLFMDIAQRIAEVHQRVKEIS